MKRFVRWQQQAINLLRLLPWTLHLLWQSHRGATVGVALLTLLQAIVPVAQLWLTRSLVDQVALVLRLPVAQRVGDPVQTIWLYVGLEATLLLVGLLFGLLAAHLRNVLQEHLVYQVQLRMLAQSARLDLAAYESPAYYDQLHRAQQEAMVGPINLISAVLDFVQTACGLLSVIALVLAYQSWVALLLISTTIPSFWAMLYYGRQRFLLFHERTPDGRRAEYLSEVLTSDVYAKEIRVWGLTAYLTAQIGALRGRFRQENIDLSRRQTLATLGGELLSSLGYYSAYLTVVAAAITGRFSLGDLTLYAGLFTRAQSLFEALLRAMADMLETQLFMEQLNQFLQLEPSVVAPAHPNPVPPLTAGLTVQNLTFTYPGMAAPVLRAVSFTLQPGQCVAVVGDNGAGKTTLVKLLLRLYDPDAGAILADGADLRLLDPNAWRRQVGVVFQDYARYQLTAQENVGFGDVTALADLPRIRQAARVAGIDGVLSQLPAGYATQLGRRFEGGQELSLGQWQRVAVARALLRDAPLLVLDEPTAALDAQAEYELFKQWRALAQGRMTLLISHRFSTVRMADLILVLENGTILEKGTHDELLAKNGRYAHLFRLQAESYQLTPTVTQPHSNGHQQWWLPTPALYHTGNGRRQPIVEGAGDAHTGCDDHYIA